MNPDLHIALQLADAADEITMRSFRSPELRVETKPDMTPVTEADRAVEKLIAARLERDRHGDGLVGEEFGVRGADVPRRWIVDPIDGTKNYVRGIPVFATLIALEVDGQIEVGVASAPAMGRRWYAARGEGAFANGEPIRVSAIDRFEEAHISYASLDGWERIGRLEALLGLTQMCARDRGFGDFWQHVLVAQGSIELALEPEVSLWDLAAVQVIVEEAGGRFSDLSGVRWASGGNALSSNGPLHDEALELLRSAIGHISTE